MKLFGKKIGITSETFSQTIRVQHALIFESFYMCECEKENHR